MNHGIYTVIKTFSLFLKAISIYDLFLAFLPHPKHLNRVIMGAIAYQAKDS